MERMSLLAGVAVALTCVVAPVAVAAGGPAAPSTPAVPDAPAGGGGEASPGTPAGPDTPSTSTDPAPPPEPTPVTQYFVWGCLTEDATPVGASMRVIWGNREMRTALAGADMFTVGINADTSVRRGWSWHRRSSRAARSAGADVAGLRAGDIVGASITARPGISAATALPAADVIRDFGRYGRSRVCAVPDS